MNIDDLFDAVASFDPIDRIEGVVFTFRHADWRGQWRRWNVLGLVVEFFRCVFSLNTARHEFERGEISGAELEGMMGRHGVKLGDRALGRKGHLTFITKARQSRWADYLIRRYGANATTNHDSRNDEWARDARERLGKEPPVRRSRARRGRR